MKSGNPPSRRNRHTRADKRGLGKFRSRSEKRVADHLRAQDIAYRYEKTRIYYRQAKGSMYCPNCGEVPGFITKKYLPDFELSNGVFIEVKGRFTSIDRNKLKAVKKYHPELNICLLFDNDRVVEGSRNRIRYGEWANANGFPWAVRDVPEEWLKYADSKFSLPITKMREIKIEDRNDG